MDNTSVMSTIRAEQYTPAPTCSRSQLMTAHRSASHTVCSSDCTRRQPYGWRAREGSAACGERARETWEAGEANEAWRGETGRCRGTEVKPGECYGCRYLPCKAAEGG